MQRVKLTRHAAHRLNERCTLPFEKFKRQLNKGATIQLSQQRGGRHVHRLFFSIPDKAWLVAVQDDNDGGVLTTLPLAYFENLHGSVTALNRRRARKLAREFEAREVEREKAEEVEREARLAAKEQAQKELVPNYMSGWKVRVQFDLDGKIFSKNVGRTIPEHGNPETWGRNHPVHIWFRERLDAADVPIMGLLGIWLEHAKDQISGDSLLENLSLTEDEIRKFR